MINEFFKLGHIYKSSQNDQNSTIFHNVVLLLNKENFKDYPTVQAHNTFSTLKSFL